MYSGCSQILSNWTRKASMASAVWDGEVDYSPLLLWQGNLLVLIISKANPWTHWFSFLSVRSVFFICSRRSFPANPITSSEHFNCLIHAPVKNLLLFLFPFLLYFWCRQTHKAFIIVCFYISQINLLWFFKIYLYNSLILGDFGQQDIVSCRNLLKNFRCSLKL